MAKIYANLIMKGAICPKTNQPYTIDDVPAVLKDAVQAILDAEAAEAELLEGEE